MAEKTLVPSEKYLKTGCHIGTTFKSGDMRRYVFKKRTDGLKVLDIMVIDERIRMAVDFLSKFPPEKIVVVSRKLYGQKPIEKFAGVTGATALSGRFVPGMFTNPESKKFYEPEVLVVTEPDSDSQAIREAVKVKIPVVALASTNNRLRNVDLVIPVNNKGRKSLALVYWLLARGLSKKLGIIKKDSDFKVDMDEFEYQMQEGSAEKEEEVFRARK